MLGEEAREAFRQHTVQFQVYLTGHVVGFLFHRFLAWRKRRKEK